MEKPEDIGRVHGIRDGNLAWIVFENRARLNALSPDMAAEALRLVRAYEGDPDVRVILLRGDGEKAFISGGDISKFKETRFDPATAAASRGKSEALIAALTGLSKPLVAMIHGYCLGGGMGVALTADLRFGSTTSQLGIPAALRGLAYAPEGLAKLVSVVGPSVAKDMMFSGRRLGAGEALRVGLLNQVHEPAELEARVLDYARQVAANAPLSVRASKFCINQLLLDAAARDHERMRRMQEAAAGSADFRESTLAFMEKRKPVFTGR